jgi:hypothetical protein
MALNVTLLVIINAFNLHYTTPYTPEQHAGRAYPGWERLNPLLLSDFLQRCLERRQPIVVKLTGDPDLAQVDIDLPWYSADLPASILISICSLLPFHQFSLTHHPISALYILKFHLDRELAKRINTIRSNLIFDCQPITLEILSLDTLFYRVLFLMSVG